MNEPAVMDVNMPPVDMAHPMPGLLDSHNSDAMDAMFSDAMGTPAPFEEPLSSLAPQCSGIASRQQMPAAPGQLQLRKHAHMPQNSLMSNASETLVSHPVTVGRSS